MRYDQKIYFVTSSGRTIDWETGEETDGKPVKVCRPCLISDMGVEVMELLFGGVASGAKEILIQGDGPDAFDYLEDDQGVKYTVVKTQRARHDTLYQVRERHD